MQGIAALRPKQYKTLKQRERKVYRAYGGSLCAGCVKNKIIRAFLVEEQKIVKAVMKNKKPVAAPAAADKAKAKAKAAKPKK